MNADRLQKQIDFLITADGLKRIRRMTPHTDRSRRENSAEHSWHIALAAVVLREYAPPPPFDLERVICMLLVHDLVEIDAGDTYCYDHRASRDQEHREAQAADRLFSLLPADQAKTLRSLWEEFERGCTSEARFANALDRLQPLLQNFFTQGMTWRENGVSSRRVRERMRPIARGAPYLWPYVEDLIRTAVEKGYLEA